MTDSLDWPALVEEAIRRRKAEGLTQKELAALANVSTPTLISFEKGETSINLDKAIDILKALSLFKGSSEVSVQDKFVVNASERWKELVAQLPSDHPSRLPHGYVTYDYEILGNTRNISLVELRNNVLETAGRRLSGWPPFWLPAREGLRPYVVDDVVECWLGNPDVERAFVDAAHADFWRVSPEGRTYLRRGYQEDSADLPSPGTIFDLILPIWRNAEVLIHAQSLGALIAEGPAEIRLRTQYTGLLSRELAVWASPNRVPLFGTHRSRTNEVTVSMRVDINKISDQLSGLLFQLLRPLYERFDFFELSESLVQQVIQEMLEASKKLHR